MKEIGSVLLAGFFFLLAAGYLRGQQDDPSEILLKAYLSAQQGEKLEHENRLKTALAKYRFAGSLIEELRKSHADWQPAIVEYRGRKIGAGILRIQERMSRQNDLTTDANRLPEVAPSLRESDAWSEPGPEVVAPQGAERIAQVPSDAAIKEATRKIRSKVDQLQTALEKSRADLETARKEKELVNTRLKETDSKLEKARNEIEKSKKSEGQVRDQLAQVQESLKALQSSRDSSTKEQQQLRAEVARLKDAVAAAEEARVTTEKQRDQTNTKFAEANEQIATLMQERDEALAQLKGMKEAEQRVQALLSENSDLKQRLANAEKDVRELGEDAPKNAEEFAKVKQQVAELQQQLAETQKQNQYFEARVAELGVQLDEASSAVQNAKLMGANSEETAQLAKENELLRNVIVRERQEEAHRYQAKKLMLTELDKLKIKSDALNKQIEFLAQPVTKLSSEELALLRQPVVSISDENSGTLKASFIFAKKSPADSVELAEPDAKEKSPPDSGGATTDNSNDAQPSDVKPEVPDDLRNVARAASGRTFQAAITSQAGSPTPRPPQSITPQSRRSSTRRLRRSRSPCIQTGGRSHSGARKAASHAAVTASVSILPARAEMAARVAVSRSSSGTPRKKLCSPGGGPPVGSICCRAATNCPRSVASWWGSAVPSAVAVSPSSHV